MITRRPLFSRKNYPLWLPYLVLLGVGVVAHFFAIRADYFMDDRLHLLGAPGVADGLWHEQRFRWLPILIWSTVVQTIGYSAPVFHALTLGVHLFMALMLLRIGKDLLRHFTPDTPKLHRELAAFLGAAIFACHPLATEPVHYARCLMIALVAMFGMLTVWCALRLIEKPNLSRALWLLLVICLGTFSKQPGVGHVTVSAGLLFVACAKWETVWNYLRHPESRSQKLAVAGIAAGCVAMAVPWFVFAARHYDQANFLPHTLSQGRVFWAYVQRVFLPVNLAVDHYVPWTMSWRDPAALAGLAGILAVSAGAVWMFFSRRWKLTGLLLCLALAHILIRFGYVGPELMVEYRLYPSLPWIGLLAGWGLAALIRWNRITGLAFSMALILSFTGLSMARSHLWMDAAAIARNAVDQYPMNLRAIGSVQYEATLDNQPERVLALKAEADAAFENTLAWNRKHEHRAYEISRLHLWYANCLQHEVYATAKLHGAEAGLEKAEALYAEMAERFPRWYLDEDRAGPDPDNPLVEAGSLLYSTVAHQKAVASAEANEP